MDKVIKSKLTHSLKWLPMKFVNSGAQSYIDGSPEAKIISQFRLGNGQLKNRDSNGTLKECPICPANEPLTEAHLTLKCSALDEVREQLGISQWLSSNEVDGNDVNDSLRLFLGDDGAIGPTIRKRGHSLIKMRQALFARTKQLKEIEDQQVNDIILWQRANDEIRRFKAKEKEPMEVFGQDHSVWDSWSSIVQ